MLARISIAEQQTAPTARILLSHTHTSNGLQINWFHFKIDRSSRHSVHRFSVTDSFDERTTKFLNNTSDKFYRVKCVQQSEHMNAGKNKVLLSMWQAHIERIVMTNSMTDCKAL